MKKTEVLRRQVLFLGVIFLCLGTYLTDSYLGFRVSATETLSRLPASLVFGTTPEEAPRKMVTRLELDCKTLAAPYQKAIATKWVQLQLLNCPADESPQIRNTTNGFEASMFKSNSHLISDLITLANGENQIAIRGLSSLSSEPVQISITLQK